MEQQEHLTLAEEARACERENERRRQRKFKRRLRGISLVCPILSYSKSSMSHSFIFLLCCCLLLCFASHTKWKHCVSTVFFPGINGFRNMCFHLVSYAYNTRWKHPLRVAYAHTHMHTHARMHARTRTRARARTHTHTHTHTGEPLQRQVRVKQVGHRGQPGPQVELARVARLDGTVFFLSCVLCVVFLCVVNIFLCCVFFWPQVELARVARLVRG